MKMKKGIKDLVAEAEAAIETMSVDQVKAALADPKVQLIDIRDVRELWRDGGIPGAYHAPRGMLEFWVDPDSPYHKELFASGKKFVFFCAGGMRSALAAKTVHDMGLAPVAHMAGGFGAWVKAGGTVEKKEPPPPPKPKAA
jgi:rhodanese-related sulfurtransferase